MIDFSSLNLSKNNDGLVPAIIQDAQSLQVLMLGYMNREAYEKTMETGLVTFFSRSRQCLWTKGETSGNKLHVQSVAVDCDNDTLLIKVLADGPVCHKGTKTCWGDAIPTSEGFIRRLQGIVQERHREMPEGSYTTYLYTKGTNKIAQKVGEEAVETVIEAVAHNRSRLIYETSDLIYHLLVLLENEGITLADIEKELESRHKE